MATCASCNTNNIEGTQFCVNCGAGLTTPPAPEAWRMSGDLNNRPADKSYRPTEGYTPQPPPPSYPAYNPQQGLSSNQPVIPGATHPAIPALISFFFPGIGLLFVPNKAGLGIGIFAATLAYAVIATILTFVVVGVCLFMVMPLINIAAAIHSWDEAAKASNGQFQPILFK
jgi:hypothetical protein